MPATATNGMMRERFVGRQTRSRNTVLASNGQVHLRHLLRVTRSSTKRVPTAEHSGCRAVGIAAGSAERRVTCGGCKGAAIRGCRGAGLRERGARAVANIAGRGPWGSGQRGAGRWRCRGALLSRAFGAQRAPWVGGRGARGRNRKERAGTGRSRRPKGGHLRPGKPAVLHGSRVVRAPHTLTVSASPKTGSNTRAARAMRTHGHPTNALQVARRKTGRGREDSSPGHENQPTLTADTRAHPRRRARTHRNSQKGKAIKLRMDPSETAPGACFSQDDERTDSVRSGA